jgi:arylsulfatase A-like enzyme
MTDRQRRECMACYYAMVTEVDLYYGKLLDWLDETGQADNTIVVFTSDHGELMGAHGLYCKNISAFEEVYHLPMVVAGPGIAQGLACDARVGLHDLGPTLLEMAEVSPIDFGGESRAFAQLLADPGGEAARKWNEAYAEYFGNVFRYWQRVLWQDNWKFVFNGYDMDELYDLAADPGEIQNLANNPEHRPRVESMMKRIWQIMKQTGDKAADLTYPGTRVGAIGPRAMP